MHECEAVFAIDNHVTISDDLHETGDCTLWQKVCSGQSPAAKLRDLDCLAGFAWINNCGGPSCQKIPAEIPNLLGFKHQVQRLI
jgi:hypothetical protein